MVMRGIRHEIRRHRPVEMSVQQFRTLRVVHHHPGASLQVVAAHLGLTTASASKLIDSLTKTGLISRTESPEDRRKVVLDLTTAGLDALETARSAALGRLSELLAALDEADRSALIHSMKVLRAALAAEDI